jgi:hypothetical protein
MMSIDHRIRRQETGTEAEHRPATRLIVELNDAIRDHQGMVVR